MGKREGEKKAKTEKKALTTKPSEEAVSPYRLCIVGGSPRRINNYSMGNTSKTKECKGEKNMSETSKTEAESKAEYLSKYEESVAKRKLRFQGESREAERDELKQDEMITNAEDKEKVGGKRTYFSAVDGYQPVLKEGVVLVRDDELSQEKKVSGMVRRNCTRRKSTTWLTIICIYLGFVCREHRAKRRRRKPHGWKKRTAQAWISRRRAKRRKRRKTKQVENWIEKKGEQENLVMFGRRIGLLLARDMDLKVFVVYQSHQ